MVYPGHWDFVKLGGVLLYPLPPSQFLGAMDYFGSNGKGPLRMGHGILSESAASTRGADRLGRQ
jgi:hypothetical protein